MKKAGLILGGVVSLVLVLAMGSMVYAMTTRGKAADEDTNRQEGEGWVDRGEEETVSSDSISYKELQVTYQLPDGFYFEYENEEIESGIMKEYMDHNFTVMADVTVYENHVQTIGLIDDVNSENTQILKDDYIDAMEWFRIERMVYLERDEESDIKKAEVNGREIFYFTKYKKNDSGVMQGLLAAVTKIDDDHYYCVKISEFDHNEEPAFESYEKYFEFEVK